MAVVGIAVLFITAAFIVDVTQSSCSVSYIATCHRSVENYYFNTPTNDSDYSAFCSQVSSTCSSTLSDCSCTTPLTNDQYSCLDYIGLKNAIASVCNSADDRRVFINNRPCIVAYVDSKVSTCRAKNTEDCTGYNATFKCFYNAMLASCNKETAEMMTRFELKRYKPLLDSISCTIVTSDYMPSSAALRGTVFGSTVPAALLFIAVMY